MSSKNVFTVPVPRPGRPLRVTGLCNSAEALAIAQLAEQSRVVVFAHDAAAALRLTGQLGVLLDATRVHNVVGWEVLPYEATSPPRSAISARLAALGLLYSGAPGVFVIAAQDALLPCMPPKQLAGHAYKFAIGDSIDIKQLSADLVAAGSANVDRVRSPGEFAVYGGQLDLYPGGVHEPYRLVLDGDLIEQIRTFDPATQLSTGKVSGFEVMPACEYPLDDQAVVDFRRRWRERFGAQSDTVYEQVSCGQPAEGAEFYLPLFYEQSADLFAYLQDDDVLWMDYDLPAVLDEFGVMAAQRYARASQLGHPALAPARLFLNQEQFFARTKKHPVVRICESDAARAKNLGAHKLPQLTVARGSKEPYGRLARWLAQQSGRVVFTWFGQARRERVVAALDQAGYTAQDTNSIYGDAGIYLLEAAVAGGFDHAQKQLAVVTESELHAYVPSPATLHSSAMAAASFELEINPGDLVVHDHHGVAKFCGLETMPLDGLEQEFIRLEFAKQVTLYVAVAHCHLISRYRQPEPGVEVELHMLGNKRWSRQRTKAQKAARDTAAYLLDIHARRAAEPRRVPPNFNEEAFADFCAAFAYAETADQARVSAEVVADMCAARPMDRLLCGDVGFGKTEIAMRAAWVAVATGRQVAVLAPTTLLADQLARCFVERFAGTNTKIVELSGMRADKERSEALRALARNEANIVVGTHALLTRRVDIPRLGLLVIDEEHRFGVRQKEQLRERCAGADVLALSATPIPRSLAMAMEGLRDMSIIATPPADRLAVRTFLAGDDDHLVRDAITRELTRGGQVFYLHHRVQSIHVALERVCELAPTASVEIAHGQLPTGKLEAVMRRFYRGEIDVLVCTTIIESGIDVPNANTMIVSRADMFGLAQLHQLRGRVGRSARQAYVYFLNPAAPGVKSKVDARLKTLSSSAQLGGGYYIAVRDMEIRGVGEILGEAQSGAVFDVGIEVFKRLLDKAARAARDGYAPSDCETDFGGLARLPDNYCANAVERMRMYRRLAAAGNDEQLGVLSEEMLDRFGAHPLPVRMLLESHRLRLRASVLGITKIQRTPQGLHFAFSADPPCADALVQLAHQRNDIALLPDHTLRIKCNDDIAEQQQLAFEFCARLKDPVRSAQPLSAR